MMGSGERGPGGKDGGRRTEYRQYTSKVKIMRRKATIILLVAQQSRGLKILMCLCPGILEYAVCYLNALHVAFYRRNFLFVFTRAIESSLWPGLLPCVNSVVRSIDRDKRRRVRTNSFDEFNPKMLFGHHVSARVHSKYAYSLPWCIFCPLK